MITAAGAIFAALASATHDRAARSQAAKARDYVLLVDEVAREQQAMAASDSRRVVQLQGNVNGLFNDLQHRTGGVEHAQVTTLALAFDSSMRGRQAERLAGVRAGVLSILRNHQASWAVSSKSSMWSARGGALLVAAVGASFLLACLLFLLGGPVLRRRRAHDLELERLSTAANTDSLTGLGNHRAFHNDLSEAIQRRAATGSTFALMAIDLDGLKQINDTHGHQAGDRYIQQVSEILRSAIGREGAVFRTGGDEFMALLPDRRNWHALVIARAIEQHTRAALGRRAVSIGLTESTGMEARSLLIHEADVALYEAKRTKLAAVTYHPSIASRAGESDYAPTHHQKALAAALARAVDAKDAGTRGHSETVAALAAAIGERLEIQGDNLERLRLAGLLHDVGKIGVPDALLQKSGALSLEEEQQMQEHAHVGQAILIAAEMPIEAEWVLHHHERCDGKGYPSGLPEEAIPLESRIIAVADAFEAITGERPYRERLSVEDALVELRRHAGTQFDGRCVEALAELMGTGDVSSQRPASRGAEGGSAMFRSLEARVVSA